MNHIIGLTKLTLTNFKGILSRVIFFDGNTNIFGANETGKSTTYTAFNWLLTGKDEFDRKDFEIKNTVKKQYNVQAHEVEGIFEVDNVEVKLKRVYLEKWTKPTGQTQKVFDGHVTEFYIDDVKSKLKEYQDKVDSIIDPTKIKLLTNPYFFNTMPWQNQRSGLLNIAGTITNDEIFDAIATPAKDFGSLISAFNQGEKLETYKAKLASKKLMLKKAAVEFLPRIDEARRNKPETQDWAEIQKNIAANIKIIAEVDALLNDSVQSLKAKQSVIRAKQNELHELETQLSSLKQKIKAEYLEKNSTAKQDYKIYEKEEEIVAVKSMLQRLQKTVTDNITTKAECQAKIEARESLVIDKRNKWALVNAEVFVFDESKCECPTCHQSLPEETIESKKLEMRNNFNADVLKRKTSLVDESNVIKEQIRLLKQEIADIDEQTGASVSIESNERKLVVLESELADLKKAKADKPVVDVDQAVNLLAQNNADYLNIEEQIDLLKNAIANENAALTSEVDNSIIINKKSLAITENKEQEKLLALKETIENTEKRIVELEAEENANAQAIANIEQQEFEVDAYTRAHMDILEKRVNKMFEYVQFRLFQPLVNGGIEETCVCLYKGVPYPTLNTAGKLFAGLDILNTFSNYYKISAPVFCDCRESVTIIPETSSQVISLIVNPEDKTIRTEKAA